MRTSCSLTDTRMLGLEGGANEGKERVLGEKGRRFLGRRSGGQQSGIR